MDSGGGAVEADREAGREADREPDREADREPDREPDRKPGREGEGGNQWSIFSRIPSSGQVLSRDSSTVGCRWVPREMVGVQPSEHPTLQASSPRLNAYGSLDGDL